MICGQNKSSVLVLVSHLDQSKTACVISKIASQIYLSVWKVPGVSFVGFPHLDGYLSALALDT